MKTIPFPHLKQLAFATAAVGLLWPTPHAAAQKSKPDSEWVVTPGQRLLDRPNVLPNSPVLGKSLGGAAEYVLRWQVPPSGDARGKRRPEVERAFRKAIGLEKLPERTPLNRRRAADLTLKRKNVARR